MKRILSTVCSTLICAILAGCAQDLGIQAPKEPLPGDIAAYISETDRFPDGSVQSPIMYQMAGFARVEALCTAYFNELSIARTNEQYWKGNSQILFQLANAILTATDAGTVAIGITSATGSAVDNYFNNLEKQKVFSKFAPEAYKLIRAAMAAHEQALPNTAPTDFVAARRRVAGYAHLCTETSIDSYLHQAIANAKPVQNDGKETKKELGASVVTDYACSIKRKRPVNQDDEDCEAIDFIQKRPKKGSEVPHIVVQ